ncbi:Surface presentation of antigens protein SpaS [Sodalis glossinidius str. 'morsitans']|uniref:Surface presentation of antigens protein SpaS n=2 Tax=Sodalis glossinidius TaxID=63612 RepID=Q2NR69_SODGM|nr:EscU/YscU/HrcU family type III secretion system export apparatus switch protein [Sodalis glossinidius]AAS66868.1 SpaS [Sodalis glossinidius]BAE75356.1 type III secretion apparatus [Sodalis glossinidius str. 'morsitans']CRL46381.1 Surface presentation of antigens protein SpaS [Sodalis glossinidius str. 'morsitans']
MSNKTEKPTPKRLRDAAKKGQAFKSRDVIIACMMLCGVCWLTSFTSLESLMDLYRQMVVGNFSLSLTAYRNALMFTALQILLPIIAMGIVASALPLLLQTGFMLATRAFKLNFQALNPTRGIKKIFSLRTAKDCVKALLYLAAFAIALMIVWRTHRQLLFEQLFANPQDIVAIWRQLLMSLVLTCLLCIVCIVILDIVAEYFLHLRSLKMDKQEVRREMKEQEGDPEIKHRRREAHMEILSEQTQADIKGSQLIIANPTHLAVGIYHNPDLTPLPFISVLERNQRALAVRDYAKKVGVSVIEDVQLARRIYYTHHLYSFVKINELDQVLRLLSWLQDVENAGRYDYAKESEE